MIEKWIKATNFAEWMTPDAELVASTLAKLFRQDGSVSRSFQCNKGLEVPLTCEQQDQAFRLLQEHGLVQFTPGELTVGCCFSYSRLIMKLPAPAPERAKTF